MGRLPETFAGQPVVFRVPYVMSGTFILPSASGPSQMPTSTFMCTEDKPFEIHRMIPRVLAVDNSNQPVEGIASDLMLRLVSMQIEDLGKDQFFTKQAVTLNGFVKGTTEQTWEFADPYYLRKSENLIISLTSEAYPAGFIASATSIQVQISFEGFLVVIAPPTDRR